MSPEDIKRIRDIINNDCIARVPKNAKELPSIDGKGFYGWQFYLRRAVMDPRVLRAIAADFWERYAERFARAPFQIAGVESAAVPIMTAIVLAGFDRGLEVNAFTIRKEPKKYGLRNTIEGKPNDLPVVFVDDLTSPQHNAFWHAVTHIRLAGLKLAPYGYVLVRKLNRDAPSVIETSLGAVDIESVFTLDDFALTWDDYQALRAREV